LKVPEVLLSGNFAKIEKWREDMAYEHTKNRRPDLLED
jgi:tRNA (guanine37-N1)-methyltransferase